MNTEEKPDSRTSILGWISKVFPNENIDIVFTGADTAEITCRNECMKIRHVPRKGIVEEDV